MAEPRRPATASVARKTDDWLGLHRPNSGGGGGAGGDGGAAETPSSSYEPSSWRGEPNASRRQNFRRQSTQQHRQRASRSANLLFSDEENDDGGGRNFADLFDAATADHTLPPTTVDVADPTAAAAAALSTNRRRETSPSITVTAAKSTTTTTTTTTSTTATAATEKMPSWLSGLIQPKDETLVRDLSPPHTIPSISIKKTTVEVPKTENNTNKVPGESPSSIVSLLKGKDSVQSSILELIQDLAKKKQTIQQATITLIQDQLNSDLLIKALLMDNNLSTVGQGAQELEHLRSENNKHQLTIDHLIKKHELELDALRTKFELQKTMLHEKLDRYEERINELEEERRVDAAERKDNEKRLKEEYQDRIRVIHESHLDDLKQSAEVQKIKMNNLEEVESALRDAKPKRLTNEEMTAREISISAQENKLKDLQEEVDKQLAALEGERSALQMKTDEFQSRNQRERYELDLASKELKRSVTVFEDGRRTWEREKKSETQYIESRKQELEAVRSSIIEEQRKLAEERFEVASERCTLETMLKLDTGTGTDLIQAKLEVKEGIKELKKKEDEVEKRLELAKELEKRLAKEKCNLQERDDEIKLKSIRAEKMLKIAISKQEEGLKALESARDIQNKFDKKGKDIHNRLLDIIRREENIVQEETKLAKEKEMFYTQRKKLDLVLPRLSADEMHFLSPELNKYKAEKEVYHKKTYL